MRAHKAAIEEFLGRLQRMAGVLARMMHHFVVSVQGNSAVAADSLESSLQLHTEEFASCVKKGKAIIEVRTGCFRCRHDAIIAT